jgi:polyisoprenoid-binding protein YceI
MRKLVLPLTLVAAASFAAMQSSNTFSFQDPKGVNTVSFKLDGALEPFVGFANKVSGEITFDPSKPEATRGEIIVDVKSMTVGNARMADKMINSSDFLDVAKYPTINFKIVEIKNAKKGKAVKVGDVTADGFYTAIVVGDFTMKGKTQRITVPGSITYFKNGQELRGGGAKGDLAMVRAKFSFNRLDFGVDGGLPLDLISPTVEVDVAIAGGVKN